MGSPLPGTPASVLPSRVAECCGPAGRWSGGSWSPLPHAPGIPAFTAQLRVGSGDTRACSQSRGDLTPRELQVLTCTLTLRTNMEGERPPALGLPGGACGRGSRHLLCSVSHCRVGAGRAGTPRERVSVSLSAAEQDILPDGPQRERAQVVPKDPGGVAAQVPEPPGRRRAVTPRPALAAGPCPAQPAASGRFQTTCRPSQGGRRRRNLAAFLFKRKEEKKTQPHKEQNQ